jgi:hypothetical protein
MYPDPLAKANGNLNTPIKPSIFDQVVLRHKASKRATYKSRLQRCQRIKIQTFNNQWV